MFQIRLIFFISIKTLFHRESFYIIGLCMERKKGCSYMLKIGHTGKINDGSNQKKDSGLHMSEDRDGGYMVRLGRFWVFRSVLFFICFSFSKFLSVLFFISFSFFVFFWNCFFYQFKLSQLAPIFKSK